MKWLIFGAIAVVLLPFALWYGSLWAYEGWTTESTDDAYVNGHVTFVAPRVGGQVEHVLVDDNKEVHKGDILVQLDKKPFQIQVNLKKAAVEQAKADLLITQYQVRGQIALARSNRFKLEHAIEIVNNQIAQLRANDATLEAARSKMKRAKTDYDRAQELAKTPGAISQQELDLRTQDFQIAEAQVKQALEMVYQSRVSLGLPAKPEQGEKLTQVPDDLDQTFSTVRQAAAEMLQSAAPLGVFPSSNDLKPKEILAEFYKRDPSGDLDRIYAQVIRDSPAPKLADAKLQQAESDLQLAVLNLDYCDVRAEIDGVVTRRNVNPGNNVQVGQNLMAIRSLTEIWIDANFKETQLANLRIGQEVRIETDMYGSHHIYTGRITGFTMGTGSTLALLPPQNATGNFVKVVQRLPVRIELTNYDPKRDPVLFNGASVVPYVYLKKPPAGPNSGKVLQLYEAPPKEEKPKETQP